MCVFALLNLVGNYFPYGWMIIVIAGGSVCVCTTVHVRVGACASLCMQKLANDISLHNCVFSLSVSARR